MMKTYMVVGVIGAFVFGVSGNAVAQNLMPDLLECKNLTDDSKRLKCFDGLMSDFDSNAVMAEMAAPVIPPVPVLTPEERFGAEDLATTQKEVRKERNKVKALTASVIDVAKNKRGKYIVILENGQVWRQITADSSKLRIASSGAAGMSATIKKKSLGAHILLLNKDKRSIRVERIK